jgi:prepilin-type processing-associated H-X9-DG protein
MPGYLKGFTTNTIKENPVTTCPVFFPEIPVQKNWGSNPPNAVYQGGGTYSYNTHLDQSLVMGSSTTRIKKLEMLKRPSARAMYVEGWHSQLRVNSSISGSAGNGIWWGHNRTANFLFADGHVESFTEVGFPIANAWPAQAYGADTTLPSPW